MENTVHPEKGQFIQDLKPGQRFVGYYLLRSKTLEAFRDPSRGHYLTLILSDRSGQRLARVWEDAPAISETIAEGQVVKVEGELETFQERQQVRVLRIRPAREDEYDPRDFLPASSRDPAEMLAEIDAFRAQIGEPHLRALVDAFYEDKDFLTKFSTAPGSTRVHHAYLGGLLEHILQVLKVCHTVLDLYPQVNTDLLLSGALLYEIGKLREFEWKLDLAYTDEGRLLGHILLTDEMVNATIARIPGFPEELALRLRHMLAAHHGRYEWGSPRKPQTLEAIALYHIVDLDAQINRFQSLLEKRPPETAWTPYDRLLGRQLFAGRSDEFEDNEEAFGE